MAMPVTVSVTHISGNDGAVSIHLASSVNSAQASPFITNVIDVLGSGAAPAAGVVTRGLCWPLWHLVPDR
jgi:hypothetical protein